MWVQDAGIEQTLGVTKVKRMSKSLDELVVRIAEGQLEPQEIRREILELLWSREQWYWFPSERPEAQLDHIAQRLSAIEGRLEGARCRAPAPDEDHSLAYLVTGVDGDKGHDDLRSWLHDCHTLEIADPYFFQMGSYRNPHQLIEEFHGLMPVCLRRVTIYHKPKPHPRLFESFAAYMRNLDIKMQLFSTTVLHDRVWIKNGNSAKVVGTSFNGLGCKLAFILNLPESDRNAFREQMSVIRSHQRTGHR